MSEHRISESAIYDKIQGHRIGETDTRLIHHQLQLKAANRLIPRDLLHSGWLLVFGRPSWSVGGLNKFHRRVRPGLNDDDHFRKRFRGRRLMRRI